MKKETAIKKITAKAREYLKDESEAVIKYMIDLTFLTFSNLEDADEVNDDGKPYTSNQNLNFAIAITLDDVDTPLILKEARKEASK